MVLQPVFTELGLTQRQLRDSDRGKIHALFVRTFTDSEGPSEGELIGRLVRKLMDAGDSQDVRCFVALLGHEVIGSIFFSRLWSESSTESFLLSPVAVDTAHQGQGVGQKLIRYGIDQLREEGVQRVFTYGDPRFYSRVGFEHIPDEIAKAPFKLTYPEAWLVQSLAERGGEPQKGPLHCVEAFRNPHLW
ncbi:MAG: N-acetyltransferase [Gammaproteobacteria bacterium]|jgi:predicted N-acetyltransferase YhbS